jgi:integrase
MIKGVHFVSSKKPGCPIRWYIYAWRGGPRIQTAVGGPKPKLSPKALLALTQALSDRDRPRTATLADLIRRWRQSPEWKALSPGTQKTWGSAANAIETKWGGTPISVWSDPRMVRKVVQWRDSRAATPRAADNGILVLRTILNFARLRGEVPINAAEGVPGIYHGSNRADIIWTDEDIEAFVNKAHELKQDHIADGARLAALTGLRRQDLVTLTWDQVGETTIQKKALKSSRRRRRMVVLPKLPALNALLKELKTRPRKADVETVLVNSCGRPWSGDGFGGSFNRIRDAAGIVHVDPETGEIRRKHLHDLRGTFASKLMLEASKQGKPLTNQEIADLMGWSPDQIDGIRRTYVDQDKIVVAIGERIGGQL